MQTSKGRNGSSAAPQRFSPRVVSKLKTTGVENDSATSSNLARTPRERSPKVIERRSPKSPVTEKKRPSRISELESQISQLEGELKRVKDQLSLSESCKKKAAEDAKESKKGPLTMSSKLETAQKQLLEPPVSEEVCVIDTPEISQEHDRLWQSNLEVVQQHHSVDSAAWASTSTSEIQLHKVQPEMESEGVKNKHTESGDVKLQTLKLNLKDTLTLVENMRNQLRDSKESEALAQALASETLLQLETARKTVETFRSDGMKATEAYKAISLELEQSRSRVNLLEGLVSKFKEDLQNSKSNLSQEFAKDHNIEMVIFEHQWSSEANLPAAEVSSLKSEVARLRSALEAADAKCHEEQIRCTLQIRTAYEQVEQIKSGSINRGVELEAELKQAKADIEDLKADLMDKETELQGISEENEGLNMKLKKILSCQGESEIENEFKKLNGIIAALKANLMDKETELQHTLEENEMLKQEICKRGMNKSKTKDDVVADLEAARAAERDALVKLGFVMEEADKSNKRVAKVTDQLASAQAANSEMEAELRKLKVQSDQWRKAAEVAATMLSKGSAGKFMERIGSLDDSYNLVAGKISLSHNDDMEDDKKKNGNVLKKIGVLWKKPQK